MSLIAFTGDWHLRGKDLPQKLNVIQEMLKICKERGVSRLFNGGDTFDVGEVGDKNALPETIIKGLTDIWDLYKIPSTFIVGNHDLHSRGCGLDFLHHPDIKVIKHPSFEVFDDFTMFYIPWVDNDKDYYNKALIQLTLQRGKISRHLVLGHLSIIGCSLGKHGYCSAEHYYSFGLPQLVNSNYEPDRMFFSHIHTKQDLGNGAMFQGALTQLRFDEDEGKEAGFHIYDTVTDTLEFINLDYCAPKFWTIKEENLSSYNVERDFIRFYTDYPEKYDHLKPNVKALRNKLVKEYGQEDKSLYQSINSNEIDINHLISKFCYIKDLKEPTDPFYLEEKKNLGFSLTQKMTGLDFIHGIHLKKVGVHKDTKLEFKKGFNVITGRNGAGKTTALSSIVGALYENVPERGNIKNLMDRGAYLEINLSAKGSDYQITKTLDNKRFVSAINYTEYTLVGNFKGAIEPIFGDMNTFTKLVFMDQDHTYDLVKTQESKRLQVLRNLFDLDSFEIKQAEYKEMLKDAQKQLSSYSELVTELEELEKELASIAPPSRFEFNESLYEELEQRLRIMKNSRKVSEANLMAQDQINQIREFEANNDVQKIKATEKRIEEINSELALIKKWDNIGCKNNPLPCALLKHNFNKPGNEEALLQELEELRSSYSAKEYGNYKHLKYYVSPVVKDIKIYSEVEIEEVQSEMTSLQVIKGAKEANDRLAKAYEALEKRVASKTALVVKYDVPELEDRINSLRFLVEVCGKTGISLLIIDFIKNELQNILNELIDFSELDITLELSTAKKDDLDSFQILFGEKKIDVSKASGGEIALCRVLFKLAIIVYLNRYFGAYKVLIMDEPTAPLDDDNTEAVVNIIKKLCQEFNQILVISHSDKIVNRCDHKVCL